MVFVKYKVADNAMAKLALPLDENATHMTIKDAVNIPDSWIWIATLAEYEGDQLVRMEKVKVSNKNWNVLTIERGFESNPLQWEIDTPVFLNVTAEVIRDIQEAIDQGNPESERNKKQSIEPNKSSNLFYPTVKAVYDWVVGLLNKKADLVNGKVPSSQLPEMQAIDESNLVHKSGNEEIGWHKIFNSTDPIAFKVKPWDYSAVRFKENNNEIGSIQAFSPTRFQDFRKGSLELTGTGNNKITIRPWDRDCMTFTSQGEVEWKGQNRTDSWINFIPAISGLHWWNAVGVVVDYAKYKIIWKAVHISMSLWFYKWTINDLIQLSPPVPWVANSVISGSLQSSSSWTLFTPCSIAQIYNWNIIFQKVSRNSWILSSDLPNEFISMVVRWTYEAA